MMAAPVQTEALVLRARDYGESDRILTLLSPELGKISAIAKGVRKQKSSLRGPTQLFCHSRFELAVGKSMYIARQAETLEAFRPLRESLELIAYASYLAELIDAVTPEGRVAPEMYILLLSGFVLLSLGEDAELSARWLEAQLLKLLGVRPQLDACVECGQKPQGIGFILSPELGGLLCSRCSGGREELSAGSVQMLARLMQTEAKRLFTLKPNETMRRELEAALELYLSYHVEKSSRARNLLRQLLG